MCRQVNVCIELIKFNHLFTSHISFNSVIPCFACRALNSPPLYVLFFFENKGEEVLLFLMLMF